jgi:drug/metabolite transporter (DMT)-like permease
MSSTAPARTIAAMAVVLALLAACAFALGSVLQQKGALETTAGEGDSRFLVQLRHRPVWLAGCGSQGAGWILQAAALDRGSLVVVQCLCSLSLVMALPLGIWLTNQVVTETVWLGAGAVTAGIALLLSVGSPQNGSATPDASAWVTAGVLGGVSIAALHAAARHRHGSIRALLLGSAAGICYALQAAVTKAFVPLVGHGLHALLSSWTTYGLIATAVAGFVLQQSALKVGVLAPAIASSNALTLFGSIIFGVTVFGESLSNGGGRLGVSVASLVAVVIGMGLLARSGEPVASAGSRSSGESGRC